MERWSFELGFHVSVSGGTLIGTTSETQDPQGAISSFATEEARMIL